MTSREARTRRRAEERKAAKIEKKLLRSSGESTMAQFNPELEDEFPRRAFHRKADLEPIGFVPQTAPQPSKRAQTNRANSQHSTGPKSPQGKLASSGNSLKHGLASATIIIPGEDPAALEALLHDLLEEHQPANPTEQLLVNEMAQSYWLTQRALRFQNECFTENGVDEERLSLFLRYQTTHERSFHKALATLLRLKKCRGEACLARRRGFVSHDDHDPLTPGEFVPQNHLPQANSNVHAACARSEAAA